MRILGWFAVAVLMMHLAGCSPEYNWREVSVGDGVGMVLFPDKPKTQSRVMAFAGQQFEFKLTTVDIGQTIFAVGHASWPEAVRKNPLMRKEMGQEVMASLYRNLGQPVPDRLPEFGARFEIQGQHPNEMTLQASVWELEQGLVEGLVMGPSNSFPEEPATLFLDSMAKAHP